MTALVAMLGLGAGWGLWLVLTGWSSAGPGMSEVGWEDRLRARLGADLGPRLGWAAAGGLLLGVTTRWPVAALS